MIADSRETRTDYRLALALILVFGFCVRAATFQSLLLDQHAWRQADTAAISRAFAHERYNILYPQVEWRGDAATGYVETGLELHAFLVATIAKLSSFKPEYGRLLSAIYFLFSCGLVWVFTRRRYGDPVGLFAAYLYAFAFPLMLFMERAFMNEALLVCLSIGSLVAAQSYLASRRWASLAALCLTTALVGAIKLPYLIILAPVFGLFLEHYRWRAFARLEPWLVSIIAIGVTAAWYTHAHDLGQQSGLTFGMFNKVFDEQVILSERFYRMVSWRMFRDILGPIGVIGLLSGLWFVWKNRRWCEGLGVLAFVAYLFLVALGNLVHNYYQLPIMSVLATIVAMGWVRLIDSVPALRARRAGIITTLVVLVPLATTIRSASFHSWYTVSPESARICSIGAQYAPDPNDRVIIAGTGDPRFLFCLDRKGWSMEGNELDGPRIWSARDRGAKLLIVYPEAVDSVLPIVRDHAQEVPMDGPMRMFVLR